MKWETKESHWCCDQGHCRITALSSTGLPWKLQTSLRHWPQCPCLLGRIHWVIQPALVPVLSSHLFQLVKCLNSSLHVAPRPLLGVQGPDLTSGCAAVRGATVAIARGPIQFIELLL